MTAHAWCPTSCQNCHAAVAAYVARYQADPLLLCYQCYIQAEAQRTAALPLSAFRRERGGAVMTIREVWVQ